MKFSIGVITDGTQDTRVCHIISSIRALAMPEYEIIVIGGGPIPAPDVVHIPFDETAYPPQHITKKKNQITAAAKYDNVVYLHDYIEFMPDWYQGFIAFGDAWDICMTKIINLHGQRWIDWLLEPTAARVTDSYSCMLPYDVTDLSYYQYISGAYWVAKKHVMQEFPQDERRHWGSAEDIEWSRRVNRKYQFSMNQNSTVHLLKEKPPIFGPAHENKIAELRTRPERQRFVWQDLDIS